MHEIGMGQNCRQPGNRRTQDPFRQMALPNRQNVRISREINPLMPIVLAGGGGWRDEKTLHVHAFLALRQWVPLAGGGVGCPEWSGVGLLTLWTTTRAKTPKHEVFPESFATVGQLPDIALRGNSVKYALRHAV